MAASAALQNKNDFDVVSVAKAVGDGRRAEILQVLAQDAFNVQELAEIFALAQPAMSHHLKILSAASLVYTRKEGTSVFYQRDNDPGQAVCHVLFEALDLRSLDPAVAERLQQVHEKRRQRSIEFFSRNEDALAQQTTRICSPDVYLDTIMTQVRRLPPRLRRRALEIGPGSGQVLAALSQCCEQVVGIDNAQPMLAGTRSSTTRATNITLQHASFEEVPEGAAYDVVVAGMVVHHMPSPARFFTHARSVLAPGGLLIVAELCSHEHEWAQSLCGDLWLGFDGSQLHAWCVDAGLQILQHQYLAQRNGFRIQVLAAQADTRS